MLTLANRLLMKAIGGGEVIVTSLGYFTTNASKNVTGIDLSSGAVGDYIVIAYGNEGSTGDGSFSTSSFNMSGVGSPLSLSPNTPTAVDAGGSYSAILVFDWSASYGGASETLNMTASAGTLFRCSAYVFIVSGASSVSVGDSYSADSLTEYSTDLSASGNVLSIGSVFYENPQTTAAWSGFLNTPADPFAGGNSGTILGWDFSSSGVSKTVSTSAGNNVPALSACTIAALTFT